MRVRCNFDRIDTQKGAVLFSRAGKVCGAHPLYRIHVNAGKETFYLCHEHKLTLDLAGIRPKVEPLGLVETQKRSGCKGFRRHNFHKDLDVCQRCGAFRGGKPSYAFLLQSALLFCAQQCLVNPYALWSGPHGPLVQAFASLEDGQPNLDKPQGYAAAVIKFVDGFPAYTGPLAFALEGEIKVEEIMAKFGEAIKIINEYEKEHPFIAPAGNLVQDLAPGQCPDCRLIHPPGACRSAGVRDY